MRQLTTVFIGGEAKKERPKATLAARKALELDPELVEAHVLLADMAKEQWRWAEAEAEYRRALELSPNNAEAHSGVCFLAGKSRAYRGGSDVMPSGPRA